MSIDNSYHRDSHRAIIKSTFIISLGTLSSRILGFLRDIILAKLLGTGIRADAFFVALRIPNLFRDLVGEGATNAAVVPVFSEYLVKKEKEEVWQFVSVVFVLGFMILSLITVLGIILAPVIVRVIAPGFIVHPEKLLLTITLTKIMFPYLILIGLTAYSMAILYSFRLFLAPAFSPCLLNIAIIGSAWIASKNSHDPVYILAIGVLVGGILQLLLQLGPMSKTGIKFQIPKTLRHPGAKRIGQLLIPRLVGAGVYELNVLVDTFCASLATIVGAGGIAAIYYANRIIQFPLGVFSLALASAILPTMSGLASQNDIERFKRTLIFSLENIFFILFPASVMTMVLSHPIIRIFFERGEFNQYSTAITSLALFYYAIGLFSFGGVKILVTAFYALQDTKTPVITAAGCLTLNVVLNFILMYPLKVGGIALASSISATANFLFLFYLLNRRLQGLHDGVLVYIGKVLLATMIMSGTVVWAWDNLQFPWQGSYAEMIKVVMIGLVGFFIYAFLCYALKVEQTEKISQWVIEKIRK